MLGIFKATLGEIRIGQRQAVEFAKNIRALGVGDFVKAGDFAADFFHGLGGKALENFGGLVLIERQEQDRGFANSG